MGERSTERRLVGRVTGFTGLHAVAYALCALLGARGLRWFARWCARIYQKPGNPFAGIDPARHVLVLELPFGAYRVVDERGSVEPFDEIAGV